MRQGRMISQRDVDKIIQLLRDTDTPIPGIATRMGVSRSAVVALNKKFNVRVYNGKRDTWVLG